MSEGTKPSDESYEKIQREGIKNCCSHTHTQRNRETERERNRETEIERQRRHTCSVIQVQYSHILTSSFLIFWDHADDSDGLTLPVTHLKSHIVARRSDDIIGLGSAAR